MSDEPKKRGKDPEFMAAMRAKAAAKKAEQRKIKEAQKLKAKQEHEHKLKEAYTILNPTPQENIDKPESKSSEPPPKPQKKEVDFKQEYYRTKLELLKQQQSEPATKHNDTKPLPHKLMKQELMHDINKTVMKELWRRHFGGDETPYD